MVMNYTIIVYWSNLDHDRIIYRFLVLGKLNY